MKHDGFKINKETAYWSYSDREWKIPSSTTIETMGLKVSHWMPTPEPPKERYE